MKFCCHCGQRVRFDIPPEDDRPRFICDRCSVVHYENPRIIVGTLPTWEGDVLLCKRAIEPQLGWWTIPAGFMENGESAEEGALRETVEEACAKVALVRLFCVFSMPAINQVHLLFLARLQSLDFAPGLETEETRLFSRVDIPWDQLAFRSVTFALQKFCAGEDQESGPVHLGMHD